MRSFLPLVFGLLIALLASAGCSTKHDPSGARACDAPEEVASWCTCETAPTCEPPRTAIACCTAAVPPAQALARSLETNEFSSTDPTLDLACLASPRGPRTSQLVTLSGYVRLWRGGVDSAGTSIEVFRQLPNGGVGERVGAPVLVDADDARHPILQPRPRWRIACGAEGCAYRHFELSGVPTETPLVAIIQDAGSHRFATVEEPSIFLRNDEVQLGRISRDLWAVAQTDVNYLGAMTGLTLTSSNAIVLGEVHDCGDVRLRGAMVSHDAAQTPMPVYMTSSEADPLPDKRAALEGTGRLGAFVLGGLRKDETVRVVALGKVSGRDTLVGADLVRPRGGSVVILHMRGRRPWDGTIADPGATPLSF